MKFIILTDDKKNSIRINIEQIVSYVRPSKEWTSLETANKDYEINVYETPEEIDELISKASENSTPILNL